MTEPLDELYFKWLYSQVGNVRLKNPRRSYWKLLRQLYKTEFVWLIPNDDNRLEDGRNLRQLFVEQKRLWGTDPNWMMMGCSVLEMLIGISWHLNFEEDSQTIDEWFWELIENLHLKNANDASEYDEADVEEVLADLIWRTYEPNGRGGLFPLNYPESDQRDVELWYQMQTYLIETD